MSNGRRYSGTRATFHFQGKPITSMKLVDDPPPKRIERWSSALCPDLPYLAPERHDHVHLVGVIDGKEKLTSRVVAAKGRIVTTKSGSRYELGEPDPDFVAWCEKRGKPIDPAEPIKIIIR
jgi:hypothetical protein